VDMHGQNFGVPLKDQDPSLKYNMLNFTMDGWWSLVDGHEDNCFCRISNISCGHVLFDEMKKYFSMLENILSMWDDSIKKYTWKYSC
jgi:hypothetical protein